MFAGERVNTTTVDIRSRAIRVRVLVYRPRGAYRPGRTAVGTVSHDNRCLTRSIAVIAPARPYTIVFDVCFVAIIS